jgi:DNA-binding beta-propeller fold protein YncE
VVKKIPLPKWYHEGILIDGNSIWVANGENGKIWVLDTKSKKVVSTIEPPAGFTEAVIDAGGGKYLVTDWDDKKLYQTRLVKNEMVIETVLTDFAPAHPAGAVSAGGRIFVTLWTRGLGTKFEIVELDKDFKEIGRMSLKEIQEPSQMAWDGRNLWITSWYNSRAYKVDVSSWKVLSSFRAPFNKATGIAWDGEYFWMTGTYADLYQLSVD